MYGGVKGDNEILIELADEAYSMKQIAAVDFDAVRAERPPDLIAASDALSRIGRFHCPSNSSGYRKAYEKSPQAFAVSETKEVTLNNEQ